MLIEWIISKDGRLAFKIFFGLELMMNDVQPAWLIIYDSRDFEQNLIYEFRQLFW